MPGEHDDACARIRGDGDDAVVVLVFDREGNASISYLADPALEQALPALLYDVAENWPTAESGQDPRVFTAEEVLLLDLAVFRLKKFVGGLMHQTSGLVGEVRERVRVFTKSQLSGASGRLARRMLEATRDELATLGDQLRRSQPSDPKARN